MSKMSSHDSFGHLKHKLWPKERLGIDLTSLRVSGVPNIVGKELSFVMISTLMARFLFKGLIGFSFLLHPLAKH
jgi:hypothetical protein